MMDEYHANTNCGQTIPTKQEVKYLRYVFVAHCFNLILGCANFYIVLAHSTAFL